MSRFLISLAIAAVALAWPLARIWRDRRVGALAFFAPLPIYAALALGALLLRRHVVGPYIPDPAMWLVSMGFFGGTLTLPAGYALLCLLARRRRPRLAPLGALLALALVGLGSWAWLLEPALLAERHYVIVTPRAPVRPLTILHVSDLQTDGPCRRERLAIEAIKRGHPDLVVFTGDFMNDDGDDERAAVVAASANRFVRALHAPLGVFAVLGDWDGWGKRWPAQLQKVLAGGSLRVLRGETVDIEVPGGGHVALFGVGGGPGSHPVRPTNSSRPGLRLVITHHPDRAAALLRRGEADLVLVGHTHGGQVVLPGLGALITHSKLGLAGGKHVLHGIPLLISRGIGLRGNSAPRIRFNCPPEISWVTVKRP